MLVHYGSSRYKGRISQNFLRQIGISFLTVRCFYIAINHIKKQFIIHTVVNINL